MRTPVQCSTFSGRTALGQNFEDDVAHQPFFDAHFSVFCDDPPGAAMPDA
jgi:hypothetical protein